MGEGLSLIAAREEFGLSLFAVGASGEDIGVVVRGWIGAVNKEVRERRMREERRRQWWRIAILGEGMGREGIEGRRWYKSSCW